MPALSGLSCLETWISSGHLDSSSKRYATMLLSDLAVGMLPIHLVKALPPTAHPHLASRRHHICSFPPPPITGWLRLSKGPRSKPLRPSTFTRWFRPRPEELEIGGDEPRASTTRFTHRDTVFEVSSSPTAEEAMEYRRILDYGLLTSQHRLCKLSSAQRARHGRHGDMQTCVPNRQSTSRIAPSIGST